MKRKYVIRLIGVALFIFICTRINLKECWNVLKQTNLLYFSYSIILGFVVIVIRTFRWEKILSFYKITTSFSQDYKLMLIGNSMASLTPGRLGEIVKPYYLYKKGHSFILGLKSIIIDRMCDIVTACILGILSLIYYQHIKAFDINGIILYLLLLLVMAVLIFILWKYHRNFLLNLFKKFSPKKWETLFSGGLGESQRLGKLFVKHKKILILTSITAFLGTILKYYFLLLALNINISLFIFVLIMSLVMLSRLIPISIMNLGSRETILIFMFHLENLSKESALSFSLLILADMLIFIVVGQIIAWIYWPNIKKDIIKNDSLPNISYS